MGLTSWTGKQVTKKDVSVAKNYLSQDELKELNRIVTMYLDFAELQAERKQAMTMAQWSIKLDAFLAFNEQNILSNIGSISHEIAKLLAEQEYNKYADTRGVELANTASDFDQFINKAKLIKK